MPKYTKILLILAAVLALWYVHCLPRRLFDRPQSSVILSSDGRLMGAHISDDGQWYLPPGRSVPEKFSKCIIAYEDKRFRFHPGVDFLAAGRALKQNISRGEVVSGASTITMQVIRLSRPDKKRSLAEKLYEMVLATRLELRCSKKKILLLYASNAPFGGNVVGIEAAAWRYFGCSSQNLSWAESATLAVLPNSPGLIHPGRNRELLLRKRNALLDKLCAQGVIDETDCALAKDEPLPEKPLPMPDMAYHLLERGRRELDGEPVLRSTLDYDLQQRVNMTASSFHARYRDNLVDNMGILVIDVHSSDILAYYGNTRGCGPGIRGCDVDMVPAARSSGSTLKPLLYAALLQKGLIYPSTLIKDTPYNHHNFSPRNFSLRFEGAVPADQVIARSLNVPSVRMLEQYGAADFLELLRAAGFDTMTHDADHYGLSLILGGAEISLQNLAGTYCRMAQTLRGLPVHRQLNYSLSERKRRIPGKEEFPLEPASIWLAFEAVSDMQRPEEESSWIDFSSGKRIAWKTGTSWGNRDAWCVGVTPDYVVAVWVGNSDGEGRAGMTGVSYAAPVMFEVFSGLPSGSWFEAPYKDMHTVTVCRESGLPQSPVCPHVEAIWVPNASSEPETCHYHRIVHFDRERRWQVNSSCCSMDEMVTDTCFVLPPAQEWYYRQSHLDYIPLPAKHPLFDSQASGFNPIDIIYPQNGNTVVCTRALDGKVQGIIFKAAHNDPDATLYWHLDGEYLGQTNGEHDFSVKPSNGDHVLSVVDGSGYTRTVRFESR